MENFASQIDYNDLLNDCLRGVVREALEIAQKEGLTGENHFYITFQTNMEGVELPQMLKIQYPDTMTIVLQHQFSDLKVDNTSFSVVLVFGGVPYKLVIPFKAVTSFADPFAKFGLSFEEMKQPSKNETKENSPSQTAEIVSIDSFRKKK